MSSVTDRAQDLGYTQLVTIDAAGCNAWEALVKPGADLGGAFRAYDIENAQFLTVKGWLLTVIVGATYE